MNIEEAARVASFAGTVFKVGDGELTITAEGVEYVRHGDLLHVYKHEQLTPALNFFKSCGETVTQI